MTQVHGTIDGIMDAFAHAFANRFAIRVAERWILSTAANDGYATCISARRVWL